MLRPAINSPVPGALPAARFAAPDLVDQLSELTGFRDRERLDATLAGALSDLMQPLSVAVFAAIGAGSQQRWLNRATLGAGDLAAISDPPWVEFDSLDTLPAHPHRERCLKSEQVVRHERAAAAAKRPRRHSITIFPLSTDLGTGAVVEVETALPLAPEEVRMVSGILRIYQNFQSLRDYGEHDTLTGLLNRKTFDDSFFNVALPPPAALPIPDQSRRDEFAPKSVYLGVIDIDHFKKVNDTYGHLIGDEVLLLLSRLMRGSFRFSDRLYRFGGEEFLVMMQCGSDAEAMVAFERMRTNTQAYQFPQVGNITISTGYTKVEPGDAPSTAFQRADRALYYAKSNGRNQVQNHAVLMQASAIDSKSNIGEVELF